MLVKDVMTALEQAEAFHLARILLLLKAFDRSDRPAIEGITKLAKLDFLLRYPTYFERALRARGASAASVRIEGFERNSVEAKMVRYRFGPWDHRMRRFLNLLAARGMLKLGSEGRTVLISLTERGREYGERLSQQAEFATLVTRAKLLSKHLDIGAARIMHFIYETFPEIGSLRYDETIEP